MILLLRAFAIANVPDSQVAIAGHGDQKPELERLLLYGSYLARLIAASSYTPEPILLRLCQHRNCFVRAPRSYRIGDYSPGGKPLFEARDGHIGGVWPAAASARPRIERSFASKN